MVSDRGRTTSCRVRTLVLGQSVRRGGRMSRLRHKKASIRSPYPTRSPPASSSSSSRRRNNRSKSSAAGRLKLCKCSPRQRLSWCPMECHDEKRSEASRSTIGAVCGSAGGGPAFEMVSSWRCQRRPWSRRFGTIPMCRIHAPLLVASSRYREVLRRGCHSW